LEILIFVLFVIVALIFAYFAHLNAKQRRQDLAALAAGLGWHFDPEKDRSHDSTYGQFGAFTSGHSRYAYNTLAGWVPVGGHSSAAKMGDYHYQVTTSDGKKSTTHTYTFSYLIVHLPYAQVPDLFIRREGIFDAVSRAFGFDDIDFESSEFSKRFYVKSSDKRFAYDVIHPRMMEYLLSAEPPNVEIAGGCCLLHDGSDWSPEDFRRHVDFAKRFFEHWPKHLTSTFQLDRPEAS
jgi:hypothetical protein